MLAEGVGKQQHESLVQTGTQRPGCSGVAPLGDFSPFQGPMAPCLLSNRNGVQMGVGPVSKVENSPISKTNTA